MRRSLSRRSTEVRGDYEIGYCKPPKHTQFKAGQSGNSKGRPKGQRNFSTVFDEALNEKISIREGERTRKISKLDGIVRVAINNALKGDPKGLAAFIQLARIRGLADDELVTQEQEQVSADDEAILAQFLARHGIATEQLSDRGIAPLVGKETPGPDNQPSANAKRGEKQ